MDHRLNLPPWICHIFSLFFSLFALAGSRFSMSVHELFIAYSLGVRYYGVDAFFLPSHACTALDKTSSARTNFTGRLYYIEMEGALNVSWKPLVNKLAEDQQRPGYKASEHLRVLLQAILLANARTVIIAYSALCLRFFFSAVSVVSSKVIHSLLSSLKMTFWKRCDKYFLWQKIQKRSKLKHNITYTDNHSSCVNVNQWVFRKRETRVACVCTLPAITFSTSRVSCAIYLIDCFALKQHALKPWL